jgi:hypothetical protein
MPNVIRRPRSRQPEPRHNRACDPGTHLTDEERRRIYRLSQHPGCSQRVIASTLRLPRTTVQSAIYAVSGRCKKQRNRTGTLVPLSPDSASGAISSRSAVCTLFPSHMGSQIQTVVQQPSLRHPTNVTSLIPPITMSMLDDHRGRPSQPAVAAYHWGIHQLNRASTGFGEHEGASRTSLSPQPPKLTPMEPRAMYESL